MSGPVGSQQWMYATSGGGFYPHEIDNSARLDTNAYFQRTPSSSGSRTTWTWNAWVKLGSIGQTEVLFTARTAGQSAHGQVYFEAGKLAWDEYNGASNTLRRHTTQVFRDPSAWYMVTIVADTTNATASNRGRVYINGTQVTEFSVNVNPSQNQVLETNQNITHRIGANTNNLQYFNGYLAEVNFIDGQALDPTDFGETKSGVWIPKSYSGTYGTNGFYLDFGNAGSLGADTSGNSNDWTSNNLEATDQVPDSPTNNFATLNPLEAGNGTYAEGNLKFSANTASAHQMASSTASISSGKWYAEILIQVVGGTYPHVGITPVATSNATYVGNNGYGYRSDGKKQALAASAESYGASYTTGDIIGIAFDADSGSITFYKNGSSQGVADSSIDTSTTWRFSNSLYSTGGISIANFGQDSSFAGNKTAQGNTDANGRGDFFYAPPAGFLALCTANLPDPAIDPAQDDVPADYFNTVLYTGNGSTQSITGVGFEPDFVWQKCRSDSVLHSLLDVVRGANKYLSTNDTSAEATPASNNRITSIDADGFSLGNSSNTNNSGDTYVAWNWKAGGTAVANTDGTIASQVSANTDAGFSIATYNGSSAGTVGHGLSSTPQLVIIKSRDASSGGYWWTGTTVIDGSLDYFQLNDTNAKTDSGYSLPTSSVFSNVPFTGGTNQVAYCFHSVEGFSKFGTYTGNGSDDGPFINTGFRPAWVMIKRTDDTENWYINDTTRSTYNPLTNATLYANLNAAEGTGHAIDYLSNGFRIVNSNAAYNANSGTYIYMAFAEMPFKYANAR
jgi:hypothetical protein